MALNMVEIEYHGVEPVLNAYRNLFQFLHTEAPPTPDWEQKWRANLTKLLTEMAKSLGYRLDQLEVLQGGYYPRGLASVEEEQQTVRRLLIDLLSNKRSLAIAPGASPPAQAPVGPGPS